MPAEKNSLKHLSREIHGHFIHLECQVYSEYELLCQRIIEFSIHLRVVILQQTALLYPKIRNYHPIHD